MNIPCYFKLSISYAILTALPTMATSEIRKKEIFLTACLYYSREPDSQPENTLSLVGITVLETHLYKVTCRPVARTLLGGTRSHAGPSLERYLGVYIRVMPD